MNISKYAALILDFEIVEDKNIIKLNVLDDSKLVCKQALGD